MGAEMCIRDRVDSPYDIADAVSEALSVEGPYMLDLVVGGLESK